jgi:hypothetical protein
MHRNARLLALAAATPAMVHALTPYSAGTVGTLNSASGGQIIHRSDISNPTQALTLTPAVIGDGAVGRNGSATATARLFWQVSAYRVSDLLAAIGSGNLGDLAQYTFTYTGVTEASTTLLPAANEYRAAYLGQWEDSGAATTDVPPRGAAAQNMTDTGDGAADGQRTLFGTAIETISGFAPAQASQQVVDLNTIDQASVAQTLTAKGFNLSHLAADLAADTDLTNNFVFFTFYLDPKLATGGALTQSLTGVTLIPVENVDPKVISTGPFEVAGLHNTDSLGFKNFDHVGGTLRFEIDGSGPDQLFVDGNYNHSGGDIAIGLLAAPAIGTPVPLLLYSGSLTGAPAISLEPTTRFNLTAGSLGDGSGDAVTATFSGSAAELFWVGGSGSGWDLNVTQNWTRTNTPDHYFDVDSVTFDDLATTFAPSITGTLFPGAVSFDNDTRNYTLGGSGAIAGGTALNHNGSGEVLILGNHSYRGTTSIADPSGVLRVGNGGNSGSLGSGPVAITGELAFNRSDDITFPNAVTGSAGLLVQDGSGTLTLASNHGGSMSYDVNAGTLRVGTGGTAGALAGLASVAVTAPGTLVFDRSGTVTLDAAMEGNGGVVFRGSGIANQAAYTISGNSANFAGPVVVDQSRIAVDNYTGDLGLASGVTVHAGGTLWLSAAGTFTTPVSLSGDGWLETGGPFGAVRFQSGAELAGPVTLAGDTRIGTIGSTGILSGAISESAGSHRLELFNGSGTVNGGITLSGDNGHSGGTTVRGVVATIQHANGLGGGPVAVEAHPTNVARLSGVLLDAVTVANNFTVAASSFLAGAGGSTGTVTLNGGLLAPGNTFPGSFSAGTLVAQSGSTLDLRIDSSLLTADSAIVTGSATLAAGVVLALDDIAAVPAAMPDGTKLTLIDYTGGSLGGTFDGLADGGGVVVGLNTFVIDYDDAGKVTLRVDNSLTPYAAWAAAAGLDGTPGKEAGFEQNPEIDGLANGLEWVLGGDPLAGDDGALVTTSGNAATGLTLVFGRAADSIGEVSLFIDWGPDLNSLANTLAIGTSDVGPSGNAPTIDIDAPVAGKITVNIPAANAVGGKLFARLRATQP